MGTRVFLVQDSVFLVEQSICVGYHVLLTIDKPLLHLFDEYITDANKSAGFEGVFRFEFHEFTFSEIFVCLFVIEEVGISVQWE